MWVVQTLLPYIIYIYKYIRLPTHEDTPSKIRPPPPPSPLTLPPPANSLIEVCSQLWDQRGGGVGAGSIITDTQLSPSMQLSKLGIVYKLSHNHPNFSSWLLSYIFTNISIIRVLHQGKHDTFSSPLDSIFLKCLTMNDKHCQRYNRSCYWVF